MKKILFPLLCGLLTLICVSCHISSVETPAPEEETTTNNTGVTAAELIMKLPITFEQFQNQANGSSRAATEISCEDCPPVNSWDYHRISSDEENLIAVLFFSILKNDVAPNIEIPLNENVDLSSINTYSQETTNLFQATIEITPSVWITDLGKVKVIYDSDNVEMFWYLTTKNNNGVGTTSSPLYLKGIFKDNEYKSVTMRCLSDGHPVVESFIKTENGFVDNTISRGGDKSYNAKTVLQNSCRKYFLYSAGQTVSVGYLDNSTACYWSNYWGSESEIYIIFDEHGYLVLQEEGTASNYTQYIPFSFVSSDVTIMKEGDGINLKYYYLDSDSQKISLPVSNRHFLVFNAAGNDYEHSSSYCLKLETTVNNKINIPEHFTFAKKNYAISAINKIGELQTEAGTTAVKDDFLTDQEIQAMGTKVDAWVSSL